MEKQQPKKYLCICDYGQVRSVAMAWFIHGLNRNPTKNRIDKLQYEAIPIGSVTSSKKTMKMMKKWADIIIDVRKWTDDNYGTPNHPELMKLCEKIWEEVQNSEAKE
jgi:hypothetical protein